MPARNIDKVPDQSDGHFGCNLKQMALRRVLNGIRRDECLNPPSSVSGEALVNWALSRITGAWHSSSAAVPAVELEMLKAGKFKRAGGTMVTFTLPDNIKTAIAKLRLESKPPARMKANRRKPAQTTRQRA